MSARLKVQLLEGVLVVAMLLAAVGEVVLPLLGPGGLGIARGPLAGQLSVPAELQDPVPGLADRNGSTGRAVELGGPTTVTATVLRPSPAQRIGLVGGTVVAGLTALGVLWLLLQIARSLHRGDVFVPLNARRLQLIAALVGAGGMVAQLVHNVGRVAVLDAASVREEVVLVVELSFLPLVAAFGIGIAAEVFRQGAALREDVEGLV